MAGLPHPILFDLRFEQGRGAPEREDGRGDRLPAIVVGSAKLNIGAFRLPIVLCAYQLEVPLASTWPSFSPRVSPEALYIGCSPAPGPEHHPVTQVVLGDRNLHVPPKNRRPEHNEKIHSRRGGGCRGLEPSFGRQGAS